MPSFATEFLTAPHPIRSVLIANRGEIACRIIATCRKLGLRSVAVHSDADADAPHVRLADQAQRLGPAPAAESYLSIPAVLAAARAAGADAIHPGYGFLSENPEFVRAVQGAGLIFIGPSADAVAAMGSKIEARRIAAAAGVPVVPGFDIDTDTDITARAVALGFPVLVKASAGGGGRGMRRVDRTEDLPDALAAARAEAGAAFGDATVFVEKLIAAPRHLEVQVFGDGQGGALHLFERDCSVQRNHQKLIEEAPAPDLPDPVRARLLDHALQLTRAIRYGGAGTVEFVLEQGSDQPFFLEMNTRLQVEHPVTEAICGVDLVEWQLRQAAGLPLPLTQAQITPRGHAIEVRINAEDAQAGFLPATGQVLDLVAPPGLRLDSGVAPGSEVGMHYDSLLAKLIAHGPDRETARLRLIAGLRALALPGVTTTQGLLADALAAPDFAEGRATTAFLARNFPDGWHPDPDTLTWLRGHAALAGITTGDGPLARGDGFRVTGRHGGPAARVPLWIADQHGAAEALLTLGPDPQAEIAGSRVALTCPPPRIWRDGATVHAAGRGLWVALTLRPLAEARIGTAGPEPSAGTVLAPLAGLVTQVHVAPGDRVERGAALVVMEAMKLVHTLTAPLAGRILRLACAPGQTLKAKTVVIEIEGDD